MNSNMLKAKIIIRGMSIKEFCAMVGFDLSTFYRKLSGKSEFTRADLAKIKEALDLSDEEMRNIFFDDKVA